MGEGRWAMLLAVMENKAMLTVMEAVPHGHCNQRMSLDQIQTLLFPNHDTPLTHVPCSTSASTWTTCRQRCKARCIYLLPHPTPGRRGIRRFYIILDNSPKIHHITNFRHRCGRMPRVCSSTRLMPRNFQDKSHLTQYVKLG